MLACTLLQCLTKKTDHVLCLMDSALGLEADCRDCSNRLNKKKKFETEKLTFKMNKCPLKFAYTYINI